MIKQLHFDECDSTQDVLKEQLTLNGIHESILISCSNQKNGRGRGNNQWTFLDGSLCFSVNLIPHREYSLTALEISLLITKFFDGSILNLKWPNDILNKDQKKVAGVLIQSFQGTLMTGVGINLFSNEDMWGGVYDSKFEFDKKAWAFELTKFITQNRYQDTEQLIHEWEEKCAHRGEKVIITEGDEATEGTFIGLGKLGEARIMTLSGEKKFYNGSLRILNSIH